MPAHLEFEWQYAKKKQTNKKKKTSIGLRMQLFSISHNLLRRMELSLLLHTHTMSLTLDLHKLGSIC